MKKFKELAVKDFQCNPFEMIGKDWMLITAKKENKVNTMTASWGGVGVMWGQNVVYIFVRNSRFTKKFIDSADHFSITFYDTETQRKNLSYFGCTSGRDEDKIAKAGYHVLMEGETPYFEEARTVFLCKKMSHHLLDAEGMIDKEILPRWYEDEDYHNMYIGKIEKILVEA